MAEFALLQGGELMPRERSSAQTALGSKHRTHACHCYRRQKRARLRAQQDEGKEKEALQELGLPRETAPTPQRQASGPIWTGDHQVGDVLHNGRYEIQERLGEGANGVTFKALDRETQRTVAVKALSLRKLRDWKQLQLFEREAQTLQALHHPAIPAYRDYFEADTERDKGFYLVQELASGKSLTQVMAEGWRADDAEIMRIAQALLEVLQYLADRRPAVVHRDVKPENIILEGGRAGGRVFLVDFGGVQGAVAEELALGSTVVGTFGYMAPEQFMGAAGPASDLYSLGCTLLELLTGRPPSAFPRDRMALQFRGALPPGTDPRLRAALEGLLRPQAEDRLSAGDALRTLRGEALAPPPADASRERHVPWEGWRARVREEEDQLVIDIPPLGVLGNLGTASFALVWNGTVASWTLAALSAGSGFGAAFSIPFWAAGVKVARDAVRKSLDAEQLTLTRSGWKLERIRHSRRKGGGERRETLEQGRVQDLLELGRGGSTALLQRLSYTGCSEDEVVALQSALMRRLARDHDLPPDAVQRAVGSERELRRLERGERQRQLQQDSDFPLRW